jgi:deoxyribodipyrimidine photolyase-related protein
VKNLRLVLGDQLNPAHSWFRKREDGAVYVLMEVRQETDYVLHHVQKVLAVFAAMRRFADLLRSTGRQVLYVRIGDPGNLQRFDLNIAALMRKTGAVGFEYQLPDEYRLDRELAELCEKLDVPSRAVDTEHFLSARGDLAARFGGKKRFLMESFYRGMRKKHGTLMDGDGPEGGRWNYDAENRAGWRKGLRVPEPLIFENDLSALHGEIESVGIRTFGSVNPDRFIWPLDRGQALELLERFVTACLPRFGLFEDAMSLSSWALFHSRLSQALNLKMLSPAEVVQRAVEERRRRPDEIDLPQIEGFVRQVIGWREYMRGVYWALMPGYEKTNFLGHGRRLPGYYWTARTEMACVRAAVSQSLEKAYAHHIQRLMVTGNFALLAGVAVDEIDRWYLGIYIDAIQWAEITNTRGMSQFADGGVVATKPYAASANYIHRMSDYCKACRYRWDRRHGERACPFNSLYWHFFERHREKLRANPRLGTVYRTLGNMAAAERGETMRQAERYLEDLETL